MSRAASNSAKTATQIGRSKGYTVAQRATPIGGQAAVQVPQAGVPALTAGTALDNLDRSLADLHETVDTLRLELEPLLAPSAAEGDAYAPPLAADCPVVSSIESAENRVRNAISAINNIRARLRV